MQQEYDTSADVGGRCVVGPVVVRVIDSSSSSSAGSNATTTVTTAQDAQKGALEVATGARIDDGVHQAVAVAEPEHDLEQPAGHVARTAQCFCDHTQSYVPAVQSTCVNTSCVWTRIRVSSHATIANRRCRSRRYSFGTYPAPLRTDFIDTVLRFFLRFSFFQFHLVIFIHQQNGSNNMIVNKKEK